MPEELYSVTIPVEEKKETEKPVTQEDVEDVVAGAKTKLNNQDEALLYIYF